MPLKIRNDIKKRLKKAQMTMADLSRHLNIPYQTMDSYLNGRRSIPEKIDIKIDKVLENCNA